MPHSQSHVYKGIRYSIAHVRKREYRWNLLGALQPGTVGKIILQLTDSEEGAHAAAKAAIEAHPKMRHMPARLKGEPSRPNL